MPAGACSCCDAMLGSGRRLHQVDTAIHVSSVQAVFASNVLGMQSWLAELLGGMVLTVRITQTGAVVARIKRLAVTSKACKC